MAEICCGVVSESKTTATLESNTRSPRRRRMEIRQFKFNGDASSPETSHKRQRAEVCLGLSPRDCNIAIASPAEFEVRRLLEVDDERSAVQSLNSSPGQIGPKLVDQRPKFGMASLCGRRRDMEDTVAVHPSFCSLDPELPSELHFFGVYDGHGCSHVAKSCRDRLHQLVKEELENEEASREWKDSMERSFSRMDKEVTGRDEPLLRGNCRCELQTPDCDAVGSTAVVTIVTPDKIVVANCGDSRAVLSRNGKAVPLSSDHKPDRLDELLRIQIAGGRVIYWGGARVLGVLAMSRAIGDNYLKPFVISEPEVSITDRTPEDDCVILASDGLWDVVSNETACSVVRMCLRGRTPLPMPPLSSGGDEKIVPAGENSDKACSDAAMLLAKLALARRSTDNISVIVIDLRREGHVVLTK